MGMDFGSGSPKDTIAAVSTPRGEAAISVIRVSGSKSLSILKKIFRDLKGRDVEFDEPRTVRVGYIVDPESAQVVDEAQAVFFRNPKTYTGEDLVEIYGHGGVLVCEKVLEAVLAGGARLAERGEFTLRAFLNGKMDLASAEAVLDVITAKNEKALLLSVKNLRGELYEKLKPLQHKLQELLARIEVDIEYPDEGFEMPEQNEIMQIASEARRELTGLAESYSQSRVLKGGIKLALIGAPNVGKSSLMNRLLQKERAIVHHVPGTTRDLVADWLPCGGMDVLVVDTAGLAKTDDPVEKEGVRRTKGLAKEADILFYIVDASLPLKPQMRYFEEFRDQHDKTFPVLNKVDLDPTPPDVEGGEWIKTSALTGEGVDALKGVIRKKVEEIMRFETEFLAINRRQHDCLVGAVEALDGVTKKAGVPVDILSIDLHNAVANIGQIFGENATENVLQEIFDNFCVGK